MKKYKNSNYGTLKQDLDNNYKLCNLCKKIQSLDKFSICQTVEGHGYFLKKCNECRFPKQETLFEIDVRNQHKTCHRCKEQKNLDEFYLSSKPLRYQGICKECISNSKPKHPKRRQKEIDEECGEKYCTQCKETKKLELFFLLKNVQRYDTECKKCSNKYSKEYNIRNKERQRILAKKRLTEKLKNKDFVIERRKKHKLQRKRAYEKRRKELKYVLNARMSATIRMSLKHGKEGKSWKELVNFDVEELKAHLESKFTNGMTWERFLNGEIEIDHFIPKSIFRFNSFKDFEFHLCWDIKNLSPMYSYDNLLKSNYLPNDGRRASNLNESERIQYLIKMGIVKMGYVYKEETPEIIKKSGDLKVIDFM